MPTGTPERFRILYLYSPTANRRTGGGRSGGRKRAIRHATRRSPGADLGLIRQRQESLGIRSGDQRLCRSGSALNSAARRAGPDAPPVHPAAASAQSPAPRRSARMRDDQTDQQGLLLTGAGQGGRRAGGRVAQRHIGSVRTEGAPMPDAAWRAWLRSQPLPQPILGRQRRDYRQPIGNRADQAIWAAGKPCRSTPAGRHSYAAPVPYGRPWRRRHGAPWNPPVRPARRDRSGPPPAAGCAAPLRHRGRRLRARGRPPAPRPDGRGNDGGRTARPGTAGPSGA